MRSAGDSYDDALAEAIIGLFKAEVIRRSGPWWNIEEVELATLEWVDGFNNRRLFEPIGSRASNSQRCTMSVRKLRPWWPDSRNGAPEKPGRFKQGVAMIEARLSDAPFDSTTEN